MSDAARFYNNIYIVVVFLSIMKREYDYQERFKEVKYYYNIAEEKSYWVLRLKYLQDEIKASGCGEENKNFICGWKFEKYSILLCQDCQEVLKQIDEVLK